MPAWPQQERLSVHGPSTKSRCTASHVAIMLHAMESLLQSQTITHAMLLRFLRSGHATLLWCLCMLCVAMLQSRLMRAAGHWQHHTASMMQPRNRTLLSRTNTTAAELFYLRHLRSCAATPYGSNKTGHAGHSQVLGLSWLAFLGLGAAWKALLQSMQVLRLFVHFLKGCLTWMCDHIWRCAKAAVAYLWRGVVVLLQSILYLKISPLELAACFHMVDASTQVSYPGNGPEPATVLLAMLCLTLAMTRWHVPRHIACNMLLCRSLSALCMQCFYADYACIALSLIHI